MSNYYKKTHRKYLLKKCFVDLQDLAKNYEENNKSGDITIVLRFFKGGITNKEVTNKVTEK